MLYFCLWAHLGISINMRHLDNLTTKQITEKISKPTQSTFDLADKLADTAYKQASVLIPFVRINDAWHIVFIRRAESEKDQHSGQVAFVGGKAEDFDKSAVNTALRETQEEIGVIPDDVEVLGKLGFHYSVSHFEITPVIATMSWPCDLTLDPAEVSEVFTLPLSWLADENNYEIKTRQLTDSNQKVPVIYYKKYKGQLLWGATARMMLSLIKTLQE